MKIKIIRKTEKGPKQGEEFEVRSVKGAFYIERFQILTEGKFLGEFVDWYDAIVLD